MFETDGNLVVHEVATQPLTQDMLRSNVSVICSLDHVIPKDGFYIIIIIFILAHFQDCYILDQRGSSVMVWKGKQASKEERRGAFNRALVSLPTSL